MVLVTGDTKVVDRGKGDGVFITTAGIGLVPDGRSLSIHAARPGDYILVSGTIGDGVYLVGTDIRPGRYKGNVTESGGMGYWAICSDPNGENIIANDLPTGQFYVDVQNGQYLELSGVVIGL